MTYFIKHKITLCILILLPFILSACHQSNSQKKIGIIVPLQHKAMDEMVAGFTETLRAQSSTPVYFKVANAGGDINVQRAILQQMKDEDYDIIVPIGTATTQMTAATIKQQSIISLAALFSEEDRRKLKSCHLTVVHDEISPEQIIKFVHRVYPAINRLVLIHSSSDKIFPQVALAIAKGKQLGIVIQPMMIIALSDLYSTVNTIPTGTQGILVLKDSLVVSGIATIAITAAKQHLPLITSDQGSVQDGAAFAIGVHEREIGIEGAKLAMKVLSGQPACSLPIVNMQRLTIFVNTDSLSKEHQSLAPIQAAATFAGYAIEKVSGEKK